ncbi:MAG: redoxin domain-containing protein [Anaerolineales bacterium]
MDPIARVGEAAPHFRLVDLDGHEHSLETARGKILVLNFWSAECEWSRRTDPGVVALVAAMGDQARLWAVASNVGESVEGLRQGAVQAGMAIVLLDRDQGVADAYGAAATPHIFVIDRQGVLRYAGAPDDSTFRQPVAVHTFLKDAMAALAKDQEPPTRQTAARGCAIMRPTLTTRAHHL